MHGEEERMKFAVWTRIRECVEVILCTKLAES